MQYREKLWPSFGVWLLVPLIGFMCAIAVAPIAPVVSLVTAVVVTVALTAWAAAAATKIEVTGGHLVCGQAKLPVSVISAGSLIAEADVRREMGPDLDARAFVTVRGWVPTMVRLTLDDPEDDTPYWLVSTRRPEELLAALQQVHPGGASWTIHRGDDRPNAETDATETDDVEAGDAETGSADQIDLAKDSTSDASNASQVPESGSPDTKPSDS